MNEIWQPKSENTNVASRGGSKVAYDAAVKCLPELIQASDGQLICQQPNAMLDCSGA